MRIAALLLRMISRRLASRRPYDWMRPPARVRGHI